MTHNSFVYKDFERVILSLPGCGADLETVLAWIQMLDGVKGGDAVELSPLLPLGGEGGVCGGSSFSRIVPISAPWPRCGHVKSSGASDALTFPALLLRPA